MLIKLSNNLTYEIIGDQEMVLSLDYYIPPLNNRSNLQPTRSQLSIFSSPSRYIICILTATSDDYEIVKNVLVWILLPEEQNAWAESHKMHYYR
jgi:hypothetical protein